MDTQAKGSRAVGGARIERAIVLQLLGDDREQAWSRERLGIELGADRAASPSPKAVAAGEAGAGRDPDVEAGLRRLEGEGVLCLSEQEVWVSRATRRLDELGLIGV
jgi:hypothetical protein